MREHYVKTEYNLSVFIYSVAFITVTMVQWLQFAYKGDKVFFVNRMADILESSSMDQWRHVKGTKNPGNDGTKGLFIEKQLEESVSLNGPTWLQKDNEN